MRMCSQEEFYFQQGETVQEPLLPAANIVNLLHWECFAKGHKVSSLQTEEAWDEFLSFFISPFLLPSPSLLFFLLLLFFLFLGFTCPSTHVLVKDNLEFLIFLPPASQCKCVSPLELEMELSASCMQASTKSTTDLRLQS